MTTGSATVSWNIFPMKGWLKFDKLGESFHLGSICWVLNSFEENCVEFDINM